MKLKTLTAVAFFLLTATSHLFSQSAKSSITAGITPIEREAEEAAQKQFGGSYLLLKTDISTDYVSAGGKIYYRLSPAEKKEDESQKLDVKKIYIKMRPLGNEAVELAAGKLYSYYLTGGYFPLAETYTGSVRWGKTGLGLQIKSQGFTGGLALPLSESYKSFDQDGWGLNGGLSYKFTPFPLTIGGTLLYDAVGDSDKDSCSKDDFSFTLASHFSTGKKDAPLKVSAFLSYTMNADAYATNTVYKFVTNCKAVGKCQFVSVNVNVSARDISFTLEGEGGLALDSDYVPVYLGLQILAPLNNNISLRPQFFYYGAFNSKDSPASRDAFTVYPRLMLYFSSSTISAGAQFTRRQTETDKHEWGFSIPLYYEYKF